MMLLQPVLEIQSRDGFALWPVAELEPYGFLALSGRLGEAEIGAAVMSIAACNDVESDGEERPPSAGDPVGAFLHGLLTMEPLTASGGLRLTDTATGFTMVPGCCNGLEERGDWLDVVEVDGGSACFGHDPSSLAERVGDTVRVTVDAERDDSPVIETSVAELRRLLGEAERDLTDFLRLAAGWTERWLPQHSASVTAALARALVLEPAVAEGPDRSVHEPDVRPSTYDARMQPHFTGTSLITDDVPALAAFYAAVLDADVEGGDPFARVTVPGAVLSFFSVQGMESMVPGSMAAAASGGFTLEFRVTDVDARHERLLAQGVEILKPPTTQPWGRRSVWLRDPEGNIVNLYQET